MTTADRHRRAVRVATAATKSASVSASVAAACVRPTTLGTATWRTPPPRRAPGSSTSENCSCSMLRSVSMPSEVRLPAAGPRSLRHRQRPVRVEHDRVVGERVGEHRGVAVQRTRGAAIGPRHHRRHDAADDADVARVEPLRIRAKTSSTRSRGSSTSFTVAVVQHARAAARCSQTSPSIRSSPPLAFEQVAAGAAEEDVAAHERRSRPAGQDAPASPVIRAMPAAVRTCPLATPGQPVVDAGPPRRGRRRAAGR